MNPDSLIFRVAEETDLASIIELLADDVLGSGRETTDELSQQKYLSAFHAIQLESNNEVIVAVYDQSIVGTLQLTYISNLTHEGTRRGQIEGVRIASNLRSFGIGRRLLEWSITRCRENGCDLIQLTSDASRVESIAFYERLGFQHTHAGLKMWLNDLR